MSVPDTGMISVVAALAERDGEVFLARRGPGRRHAGLWELPGGKVEAGEDAWHALGREIREELSLDAIVEAEAYEDSTQVVEGIPFRFLVFRTRLPLTPDSSSDHDRWGYFSPQEIPFAELAPLDSKVLRRWSKETMDGASRRHVRG